MAIGLVIAAVLLVAATLIYVFVFQKRKAPAIQQAPPQPQQPKPKPMMSVEVPVPQVMVAAESAPPSAAATIETAAAPIIESSEAPKLPVVLDVQAMMATREVRNEQILAGISENIRKNLEKRPVPENSPMLYSESKPRNTEYVRVKKEIITPHGQIRFSILKDWMATNMLAVFRRASLDWKTPEDLIAFLPAYLEPEVEIVNSEVLIIGTPGHNEKLAVPIRELDVTSDLRNYFEFPPDSRRATNSPAVLVAANETFEVVSRGVITQSLFVSTADASLSEPKFLADRSAEQLQKSYTDALRRMESPVGAEAR
jgi:hypothetical protein